MFTITFLGTSSMVPTKDRNPSAVYVQHHGTGILLDCAEGTQRQMSIAGISRSNVSRVLLSHWHADHMGGLLGLIQTISNKEQQPTLTIYGPTGSNAFVDHLMHASIFDAAIDLQTQEVDVDDVSRIGRAPHLRIEAINLHHSTPVVGYSIIEEDRRRMKLKRLEELGVPKGPLFARLQNGEDVTHNGKIIRSDDVTSIIRGKKVTYITDTLFCQQAVELAKDADLLICEATFCEEHCDKANQYRHMTSRQAAQIASMAGAKRLCLTHFSQRYPSLDRLREEALDVFGEVQLASDLLTIKV